MNQGDEKLFKAREFARLTGGLRALHHYDGQLLSRAGIQSGYRLYRETINVLSKSWR
jgi:hypothetical protein